MTIDKLRCPECLEYVDLPAEVGLLNCPHCGAVLTYTIEDEQPCLMGQVHDVPLPLVYNAGYWQTSDKHPDFACPHCWQGFDIESWNTEYGDPVPGNHAVRCTNCNGTFVLTVEVRTIFTVTSQNTNGA